MPTSGLIEDPALIVHRVNGADFQHIVQLTVVDPRADDPRLFGVLLSDLVDHVAQAYHDVTGRDARDVRAQLFKTMRDEDRFKEKNPMRGNQRGKTFTGAKQ